MNTKASHQLPNQEVYLMGNGIKKIRWLILQLLTIYPEYLATFHDIDGEKTDSKVFLAIRKKCIEILKVRKLIKGERNVIKGMSRDIFNDSSFWQKSDEEVFARINEMKERGELD